VQKQFCLASRLISGIRDSVKYDPKKLTWDATNKAYFGTGTPYNWHYHSDSGVELLYIPVEYLP